MKDLKRKALILLVCLSMLALLLLNMPSGFTQRVKVENGTYSFFYDTAVVSSLQCISNGAGTIVSCGLDGVYSVPAGFRGVSVAFDGDATNLKYWMEALKVEIVSIESVAGIVCIYGYTARLGGAISVAGEKINVQFALNDGKLNIGTPLLLGSY